MDATNILKDKVGIDDVEKRPNAVLLYVLIFILMLLLGFIFLQWRNQVAMTEYFQNQVHEKDSIIYERNEESKAKTEIIKEGPAKADSAIINQLKELKK